MAHVAAELCVPAGHVAQLRWATGSAILTVQASVTCALTGKLAFDEGAIGGKDGQEVFSER